jgi:para-nitrobenzyl esterase
VTATASTALGRVIGLQRDDIHVFKGIRYATAERFARPVPVASWPGELDTTVYGAQCPQLPGLLDRTLGGSRLPTSEDCLFLNVYRPAAAGSKRPVLVWIHGGGFTTGSGAVPWYDGSELARRGDAVVVTINYRLGALGFAGRSNLGIHDQLCALRWVGDHIDAFSGDPGNVTIFGESAGGSSVVALMATPAASGLFHRAVAMSPSITQLRSAERADDALAEFLHAAGASSLEALLDAPVDELLAAQVAASGEGGAALTTFSPCVDHDLFREPLAHAATANPVPLLVGTTRDEARLFNAFNPRLADPTDEQLMRLASGAFGDRTEHAIAVYRAHYEGASNYELFNAVHTDAIFRAPAWRLAAARSQARHPTWMYWFTWATSAFDGRLGSCHALDVPFAFHTLHRNGVEMLTGDHPERHHVADAMSAAILEMALTGVNSWARYELPHRATRRIDVQAETVHAPDETLHELWMGH